MENGEVEILEVVELPIVLRLDQRYRPSMTVCNSIDLYSKRHVEQQRQWQSPPSEQQSFVSVSCDGFCGFVRYSRSALVSQALLALLQQLCFASVSNATKSAMACAAGTNFKEATSRLSMIREAIDFIS